MYRLILYSLILGVVYWVVKRAVSPVGRKAARPAEKSEELIQDPFCHSYVPKSQSYSVSLAGKQLFFCSEDCCKKYLTSNALPKS